MYQIPEWSSFQSYKDRCPPWIRLHRRLLDNFKYQKMSAEARALLPMLWLIAAEDENPVTGLLRIRNEEIAFRLRRPEKDIAAAISEIILNGFLVDLNPEESTSYESVTESLRNCHSETETETKTKTEAKKNICSKRKKKKPEIQKNRFSEFWEAFPRQRRGSRDKAEKAYAAATLRGREEHILSGLHSYASSDEVARGYAKGAAAWLNDDRWENDYAIKPMGGNRHEQPKSKGNAREELAECLDSLRRGKPDDGTDVLLWKSEYL